jgi:leucyl/phenylalanyl-tRNA--protein transferase
MLYQLSYTPAGWTAPLSEGGSEHKNVCAAARAKQVSLAKMRAEPATVVAMHAPNPVLIPPDVLLLAYRSGVFPMSDARDDGEVFWVEPRQRAVLPLDGFHCSRSLAKVLRADRYRVTLDADFGAVIDACAAPRPGHPETWISHRIEASYRNLFRHGHAHSVECWRDGPQGEELVGGLYGVAFDRVFCGESMFSRADNASKVALAWLVALMRRAGFVLLDCQFITGHLASLGAVEIPRRDYLARLKAARAEQPVMRLGEAYASFAGSAAGSGAGAGSAGAALGVAAGAAGRDAAESLPEPDGRASSSPGKAIAQSLTQTS